MKRLSQFRSRLNLRKKLATVIAAALTAGFSASAVDACDYCDQGDGGMVACDSCASRVAGSPTGPVFKTLDAFAGGVEKFLGFDKCGSSACDAGCDACDAGMMRELMTPLPSATTTPQYHQPIMPSVPPESYTEPQYIDPVAPIPGQSPIPLPPVEIPNPNGGGIFDSLNDPFGDDEVRSVPSLRPVQPSSFRRSAAAAARSASQRVTSSKSQPKHQLRQQSNHRSATYRSATYRSAAYRQPTAASSLKRAAARPTTASRSTQPVAHRPVHQHQHATVHHAQKQVQLTKAPTPQAKVQPKQVRRQTTGQRHAWVPVNSYGQTTR